MPRETLPPEEEKTVSAKINPEGVVIVGVDPDEKVLTDISLLLGRSKLQLQRY